MRTIFFSILLACVGISCSTTPNKYNLVPLPNHLEPKSGVFDVTEKTTLLLPTAADTSLKSIVVRFADQFNLVSGVTLSMEEFDGAEGASQTILFAVDTTLATEGYALTVTQKRVTVKAANPAGFFYAIQTIKQLMPTAIYGDSLALDTEWSIPCVVINDAPRFGYRGMHMDVARHFFDVKQVKRYIDVLALHKMNRLHWHLSDDQGWRVEIKKYPRLTEVGSIRKGTVVGKDWTSTDGIPYGGFYTQEEIREVVAYAAERYITIVPEIDLPGHMVAALASYPTLGCTGGPYEVLGRWGVLDDVLCVGKEETFTFIEDVLTEIVDLFPGELIHIGGDECPKVRWEKCPRCQAKIKSLGLKSDSLHTAEHYLQSYTIKRVEKFLNDKGRFIIGWDEILEGGLAPNAVVMSWRGVAGGIQAAKEGHKVIMTPTTHLYFDYFQSADVENEPFGIGGYVPLERVYSFDPIPGELTEEEGKMILGPQANLWTEYIKTNEHLEYMLLPRLAALSEVAWTDKANKDWDSFLSRVGHILKIYDVLGYKYATHLFEVSGSYATDSIKNTVTVELRTQGDAPIYYTLDGTPPTESSARYSTPIELANTTIVRAASLRDGKLSREYKKEFSFNKATARPITLNVPANPKYIFGGAKALVDGVKSIYGYANGNWVGFLDNPLDATIDLGASVAITQVGIEAMIQEGEWVFPPTSMRVFTSNDGKEFSEVAQLAIPMATRQDKSEYIKEYVCDFDAHSARYVRVLVTPTEVIPAWHDARGKKGHMFIDEIIVK